MKNIQKLLYCDLYIFTNNSKLFKRCIAVLIIILLIIVLSCFLLANSKSDGSSDKFNQENYESSKAMELEISNNMAQSDNNFEKYFESKWYYHQALKYDCSLKTQKAIEDYFDPTHQFGPFYSMQFTPMARLNMWAMMSNITLLVIALFLPILTRKKKGQYRQMIVGEVSRKDIFNYEIILHGIIILVSTFFCMIVGLMMGIGGLQNNIIQYSLDSGIEVPFALYYIGKEMAVLFVLFCVYGISKLISELNINRFLSTIISLGICFIGFAVFAYYIDISSLVNYDDAYVCYFPIVNVFFTDWVIGNYKLIVDCLLYLMMGSIFLCFSKILFNRISRI